LWPQVLGVVLGGALAGLALGMLGAGGTIIGLPMFLYLGGPHGHLAFGTNALGVSVIALALMLWRRFRGEVDLLPGVVFAIPGLAGIGIGAHLSLLYPARRLAYLLSFLILVVACWIGYLGMRRSNDDPGAVDADAGAAPPQFAIDWRRVLWIVPTAFVVSLISGFFAIGGGFLVVPSLAIAGAIDLRAAARSSLLPITAFAGLGAIEYLYAGEASLTSSAVMILTGLIGGALGIVLGNKLPLQTLQRVFATFLGLVAIYMIALHP
jgi:uncharacterized protein